MQDAEVPKLFATYLRHGAKVLGPPAIDDGPLEHWLTVFRDHGRPADRVLPKVTREADTDEGEDDEDDD